MSESFADLFEESLVSLDMTPGKLVTVKLLISTATGLLFTLA